MATYRRVHVEAAFTRMTDAARFAGVDVTGWEILAGSPANGRAWRLVRVDPESGGHFPVSSEGNDYLGWSAREAVLSLRAMIVAFSAVQDAQK